MDNPILILAIVVVGLVVVLLNLYKWYFGIVVGAAISLGLYITGEIAGGWEQLGFLILSTISFFGTLFGSIITGLVYLFRGVK